VCDCRFEKFWILVVVLWCTGVACSCAIARLKYALTFLWTSFGYGDKTGWRVEVLASAIGRYQGAGSRVKFTSFAAGVVEIDCGFIK
jgi:hypothetical protein